MLVPVKGSGVAAAVSSAMGGCIHNLILIRGAAMSLWWVVGLQGEIV
jgi:hypothetical protein